MTLTIDAALDCAKRGWYVFPCKPKNKFPHGGLVRHGFKDATLDEDQIRAWWKACPTANIGIDCGRSELCVLDVDEGNADHNAFMDFMAASGLPSTYAVRTGRRLSKKTGQPEYGVQLYYKGIRGSIQHWLLGEHSGDIKSTGGLVLGAGSVHPDSGEEYTVLFDEPLARMPEWMRVIEATPIPGAPGKANGVYHDTGAKITERRAEAMLSILGKERSKGTDDADLERFALETNAARFTPPLSDSAMDKLIADACKYECPEPDPGVVFGGKVTRDGVVTVEEADTSLDAPVLARGPRPKYPWQVWDGTIYGDFGAACSERNYVPARFFIEALRTVVGAIMGDQITTNIIGVHPRNFTLCIAPPGAGKGTSAEYVGKLFEEIWDGLRRTGEAPLIWSDPQQIDWKSRRIGAQVVTPSSAPGLLKAITPRPLKKGETVNPLEAWLPIPRIITMAEEVRGLLANFANESTGAGLESVLCELYDRDHFTATATKDRSPQSGKMLYSLLGGITPEGWNAVFSKVESTSSGFLSRLNIVGTEETRRVATLKLPDFAPFRARLFPMLAELEKKPIFLCPTPEAEARLDEWFFSFEMEEGIGKSRLNIHAWRVALHLAWLKSHTAMELEDIEGGILCAAYLGRMREWYAPPEGETRAARTEAAIRKVMRSRRRCTVRELKGATNSKLNSVADWDKALLGLCKAGEMRVEEERTSKGRTRKTVILLKEDD